MNNSLHLKKGDTMLSIYCLGNKQESPENRTWVCLGIHYSFSYHGWEPPESAG